MERRFIFSPFLLVSMVARVMADYDCICNYAVENALYSSPDLNSQPTGYLYEFDCKPEIGETPNFFIIVSEQQKNYIAVSQQVQRQICPGSPPDEDRLPTTRVETTKTTTPTSPSRTTTTPTSTTKAPTTTTTTPTTSSTTTTPTTTTTTPTTTTTTTPTTTTSTPTTTTPTTTSTTSTTTTTTPTTTTITPTTTTTTTAKPTTTTQAPVTWPIGTYGLMQTPGGCPKGGTRWYKGWRKQDTEDNGANNFYTSGIEHYLAGEFAKNNLVTGFCIKDTWSSSIYDRHWPKGTYCILKHKSCPPGFSSGFIYWDDEDSSNGNNYGGSLPDGTYNSNTKIYYCCRSDGRSETEITLPTGIPFVLLRYGHACQSVHDMSVREVYLRWDDEDTLGSSSSGGAHPFDDGGSKDHTLHFCYYQSSSGPSFVG